MSEVADIRKALRDAMSQAALARAVGCSEAHISDIMNGKKRPSVGLAVKIARETKIPLDQIVALKPEPAGQIAGAA